MVKRPLEDTEPCVQQLFQGLYRETDMGSQDLAGVGFCVFHASSYQLAFYFMKNKLNIVSVILVAIILIPQITFASWWNPFSWSIFHKKEVPAPQVQVTDTKPAPDQTVQIQELQKQIDDLKNQQPKTTTPAPKVTAPVKKSIPTQENIVMCNGQQIKDTCPSLGKKFFCSPDNASGCYTQSELDNIRVCNGKSYNISNCSVENPFYFPAIGEASCGQPSPTSSQPSAYDILNQQLKDQANAKQEAEDKIHNSPECVSAKKAYDSIQKQLDDNLARMEEADAGSQESSELASKGADLAIKSTPLMNKYYQACEPDAYYSTPPHPTTICNFIGNTVYCN